MYKFWESIQLMWLMITGYPSQRIKILSYFDTKEIEYVGQTEQLRATTGKSDL